MKTDDILLELNIAFAEYMRRIHPFKYSNKTYRLLDNYVATPPMECAICGYYPEFEVSIIESEDGQTLPVGSDCIDRLTGQNVSEWMKNFRKKRENILANRKRIEQLTKILEAYNRKEPIVQLNSEDAKKIRTILEQMDKGENLTAKQRETADAYLTLTIEA